MKISNFLITLKKVKVRKNQLINHTTKIQDLIIKKCFLVRIQIIKTL